MTATFKICRCCNKPSPVGVRKCRNPACRGNRFDPPTAQQVEAEAARVARIDALARSFGLFDAA